MKGSLSEGVTERQGCREWDGEEPLVDFMLSQTFHSLDYTEKERIKIAG